MMEWFEQAILRARASGQRAMIENVLRLAYRQ
jgi:hypothetical protein